MNPESLFQLVGSDSVSAAEEAWMNLLAEDDLSISRLRSFESTLRELRDNRNSVRAQTMAWAAIEVVEDRSEPKELASLAGIFLVAAGDGAELRQQVLELYKKAYADVAGIDVLLDEAGLGGGRPVRRAVRTLEVILSVKPGDYLASRDDDGAARIDSIDSGDWTVSFTTQDGTDSLGPVLLADQYRPAQDSEYVVQRIFVRDALAKRLTDDPASLVVDLVRCEGGKLTRDGLEAVLVPDLIAPEQWKKWWTKARTALKRSHNIEVGGRAPYLLTYIDKPLDLEEPFLKDFEVQREPIKKLGIIEKYLRECKARQVSPNEQALKSCLDAILSRAEQIGKRDTAQGCLWWLVARRLTQIGDLESASDGLVRLVSQAEDLRSVFSATRDVELLKQACDIIVEAREQDAKERLIDILPLLPSGACNHASALLCQAGAGAAEFDGIVRAILSSTMESFEALLWLWDGPASNLPLNRPASLTLFSRIIGALEECRRHEDIDKERAKHIAVRARAVLAARKYERFHECLDQLKPSMGRALTTQVGRLENLGRAVREDLIRELTRRFPAADQGPSIQPWQREDVLFVTRDGLRRKEEEIEQHVNVKMKENSIAIGRAAEMGDLSENSEYKFALEERDLLRARLAQMNSELAIASVLEPGEVPTDLAGIGTRVVCERVDNGTRYEMTFLGPWDTDAERGLYNYLAPLGQKVLGRKVGDRLELDHTGAQGQYRIVSLENGLTDAP